MGELYFSNKQVRQIILRIKEIPFDHYIFYHAQQIHFSKIVQGKLCSKLILPDFKLPLSSTVHIIYMCEYLITPVCDCLIFRKIVWCIFKQLIYSNTCFSFLVILNPVFYQMDYMSYDFMTSN